MKKGGKSQIIILAVVLLFVLCMLTYCVLSGGIALSIRSVPSAVILM